METPAYRVKLRFVKMLNVVMLTVPLVALWLVKYSGAVAIENRWLNTALIIAEFVALYVTYGRIYEGFLVSVVQVSQMIYSQFLALAISDAIMYVTLCLIMQDFVNLIFPLITFVIQFALSIIWCGLAHFWYFKVFNPKQTAIIYDRFHGVEGMIDSYGLKKKFDVKQKVIVDDCISDNFAALDGIDTVFLVGVHSHERNIVLKHCVERNITVYVLPRIGDVIMSGARRVHLFHLPFLRVGRYNPDPGFLFVKRLFDIVVSAAAIIVLSPIIAVTALAIKLYDRGPVFYKQTRLTKDGKKFNVLKFRSMKQDAEKDGVARLSTGENDDRITPVGKFIRKVRLDELPQLFNILGGSMSIVGPRPERPEIASQYEEELPEFALRLQAKAGLTGYAQVYGKYNTTPYDKLQMDLMYISHPSVLEDLRIMFATVKILFLPESTEGVEEGMETAMGNKQEEKETENV